MPAVGESIASRAAAAAERTVGAGTARILAAWCTGSPLPEAPDRRCEGVADLVARRARVLQSLVFTDGFTAKAIEDSHGDPGLLERIKHVEMILRRRKRLQPGSRQLDGLLPRRSERSARGD